MDFVVTWVDDNDPEWRREFDYYRKQTINDTREVRFRNWENFNYWFRGVEKFAPWIEKIHFITWGHIPSWLNLSHPKLNVVFHEDFIPKKYLPTFNSRTIELNLHHIKELGEEYVLFNDDVFLINNVSEDMFFINGKPCDMPILTCVKPYEYSKSMLNNLIVVNKNFSKKNVIKDSSKLLNIKYGKANIKNLLINSLFPDFHTGFVNFHITQALLKSTLITIWSMEYESLHNSCKHTFRNPDTVNSYVQRYWQLASNNFEPAHLYKLGSQYTVNDKNITKISSVIKNQEMPILCINDSEYLENFETAIDEINSAFHIILPKKSSFEL